MEQETATAASEETFSEAIGARGGSSFRTVFVFLDLPRHLEFKAGEMPLMPEGETVQFDLTLRNVRDPRRSRRVDGEYRIRKRILKYSTSRAGLMGMTQYVEFEPVVAAR